MLINPFLLCFSLKERPISPGPGPPQHPNTLPLPSLSSPLPSTGSPMAVAPTQAAQAIMTPPQAQQTIFRPNQPSVQVSRYYYWRFILLNLGKTSFVSIWGDFTF